MVTPNTNMRAYFLLGMILQLVLAVSSSPYERSQTITSTRTKEQLNATSFQISHVRRPIQCIVQCLKAENCTQVEFLEQTGQCSFFDKIHPPTAEDPSGSVIIANGEAASSTTAGHVKHSLVPYKFSPWNSLASSVLASTSFNKRYDNSALRVTFFGSVGLEGGPNCSITFNCGKVFLFQFNNKDCTSPASTDRHGAVFSNRNVKFYFPAVMDILCFGLRKGTTKIDFMALAHSTKPASNVSIAYGFDSHILVEEVIPRSSLYLPFEHFMREGYTFKSHNSWANNFTKQKADSWLLLSWKVNMRLSTSLSCVRWFIKISQQDCTSPSPIEGYFFRDTSKVDTFHSTAVGGICKKIPAGTLTIDTGTGPCNVSLVHPFPNFDSGMFQEDNVFVEEIYPYVISPSEFLTSYNIHGHHWTGQDNQDSGTITSFTFNKTFESSALRLKFFGNLALQNPIFRLVIGGNSWCFIIDGKNCTNPSPMCTAYAKDYTNLGQDFFPFEIMGVCKDLAKGPLTVSLTLDTFSGTPDAATGWPPNVASNWIIADEMFLG